MTFRPEREVHLTYRSLKDFFFLKLSYDLEWTDVLKKYILSSIVADKIHKDLMFHIFSFAMEAAEG